MKRVILTLGLITLFSCNKDRTTENLSAEDKYSTVTLKEQVKVQSKTEEGRFEFLDVTFTAKVDKEGNLIDGEVSKNLLDYFGVKTQEEFEKQIGQKLQEEQLLALKASAEKQVDNINFYANDEWSHKDCIKDCLQSFEKGDGRGSCKFGCWVDTIRHFICGCK